MSYLELLSLSREPFSTSPDPDTVYEAASHSLCLNRLEIAIRLHRGLNVVLGPVGTGKSTLCRRLYKRLSGSASVRAFCLLDAGGSSAQAFLLSLAELFQCEWDGNNLQEGIGRLQSAVYELALVNRRTPVLLIDEGQKLTPQALELLRVLLNFETNTEKLLQIVIFAQPEFLSALETMPNLRDRINECLTLEPLSDAEGVSMLRLRLRLAGGERALRLFTPGALKLICRAGEGRPRQLIRLAHLSLLAMIMANRREVDARLVRTEVLREPALAGWVKGLLWGTGLTALGLAVYAALTLGWLTWPGTDRPVEAPKGAATVARVTDEAENASWVSLSPTSPSKTDAAPVMLGTVELGEHLPLAVVAERFYSSDKAVSALRAANPDYELLRATAVTLPELTFEVPARLYRNHQLSYGDFATPGDAYAAWKAWQSLNPRLVMRRDPDGTAHYHVVARASFSVPERAWMWLSHKKPPASIRPQLLAPYRADEKAYCEFR